MCLRSGVDGQAKGDVDSQLFLGNAQIVMERGRLICIGKGLSRVLSDWDQEDEHGEESTPDRGVDQHMLRLSMRTRLWRARETSFRPICCRALYRTQLLVYTLGSVSPGGFLKQKGANIDILRGRHDVPPCRCQNYCLIPGV